jgi:P4 family phage/plasmid primase-like protien
LSTTPPPDTLTAALALHAAGCSVLPVRADGTKAPAVNWKQYIQERADEQQLHAWFGAGQPGIGTVTGAISGGLEMFEFEGRAQDEGVVAEFIEIVRGSGLADTWNRIITGWLEASPSGGLHALFRVDGAPVAPNTKLARRSATAAELAEHPGDKVKVLIETRGERGFTVTAPSAGPVHASGRPWKVLAGGPATIATISAGEYDALHTIARMLDQMPAPDAPLTPVSEPADEATAFLFSGNSGAPRADGISPGDDYEERTSWADILKPEGWTLLYTHGSTSYWQRPGKTDPGPSATTGREAIRDRLYVFTTSTDFLAEVPYTKFGAYALLHHGGDHSAAARELRRRGYGTPAPEPVRHLTSVPTPRPATDGTAALNVLQHPAAEPGPGTYTRTDDGNALRLVDQHEQQVRYVPQRGKWLTWEGHRWAWDDAGQVREYARAIARALPNGEGEAKHRASSLSARGLGSMVSVAQTDPRIVASYQKLDIQRLVLNTPGGTVDLETGVVTPADPAKLHTRSTTVAPDASHPTPRWQRFLVDTFGQETEVATFIQRLAGYSASGDTRFHILPFLHGPGGNGKSVFLDVLRAVLGDYAATAPNSFLMAGQQQHETEVARLHGLRLVVASEVNQDARFDEAKVKLLTGGDALTARFMRQDHFTFEPTHHLWLMGNHLPAVKAGGESFWRRLRLIPFTRTVPAENKVEGLARILAEEEGPGILAWIVAGAVAVFRDGLQEPASVMAITSDYAEEEDSLARFIGDCCHLGGGQSVTTNTARLRSAYDDWCRAEGETGLPARSFGRELKSRFGIDQKRSNGQRLYIGISVIEEPSGADRFLQQ